MLNKCKERATNVNNSLNWILSEDDDLQKEEERIPRVLIKSKELPSSKKDRKWNKK